MPVLNLPNDAVVAKAGVDRCAVASAVEGYDEVQAVVAALEQQYDAVVQAPDSPNLWAGESSDIPPGDQLGAEFENFPRTVSDDDTD